MTMLNALFVVQVIFLCISLIELTYSTTNTNVVLIIADDVGHNDVSYYGSNQIPTPNIDALAYNGIILNRFYTQPSCTPSRTALLTGQYPIRLGMQGIPIVAGQNRHLPFDTITLPKKLKEMSYKTYLVGKWHLGAAYKNATPLGMGFDHHFGYWNGYISYFDHHSQGKNSSKKGTKLDGFDMHDDLKPAWSSQGEYATHLFTRKAVEVIRQQDGKNPFFLQVAHLASHTGLEDLLEIPDHEENERRFGYIEDARRRIYAGMMHELDRSVGEIVKALNDKGLLDDTLILFLSDNGAQTQGIHQNFGSNWPLRGLKFSVHEGGVRNVAIAYGKKLQQKEKINNELLHISDLLPTIYAAAGGNVSDLPDVMDGTDQWESLTQGKQSSREDLLLNIDEVNHSSGLIGEKGRFKIINGSTVFDDYDLYYGESGRTSSSPSYNVSAVLNSDVNVAIDAGLSEDTILKLRLEADLGDCRNSASQSERCTSENLCLFDLERDPCETTNLARTYPLVVEKLSRRLEEYWSQVRPQPVLPVDERANPVYCNGAWFTWLDDENPESCPNISSKLLTATTYAHEL